MSNATTAFSRATHSLARALQDSFGSNISQVKKHFSPRFVNIIHDELCNDVLARIGPSLERHRGCTIIDINPGAGLWSSKIHNLLKPSRHFLLEHRDRFEAFKPFISPLVKTIDSRYRHLSYHEEHARGTVLDDVDEALRADGQMPVGALQETFGAGHTSQDSILVLANMSAPPKSTRKVVLSDEPAGKFLRSFCLDLATRRGLHANGPVRLLMWANDSAKSHLQPRDLALRSSYEMQREELFDVREVASTDYYADNGRRNPTQDLRSAIVVAERMARAGLQTPSHRQTLLGQAAAEFLSSATSATDPSWSKLLPELENLEKRYAAGKLPITTRARHDVKAKTESEVDLRSSFPNQEFDRLIELRRQIRVLIPGSALDPSAQARVTNRSRLVAEIEAQRLALEMQLARDGSFSSTDADRLAELNALDARADSLLASYHHQDLFRGFSVADNAASNAIDPALLSWDRRPYEPLAVQDDEFWPATPLALYDFDPLQNPDATTVSSSGSAALQPVCHHRFIRNLTKRGGDDIVTALERTGPGTVDALLGAEGVSFFDRSTSFSSHDTSSTTQDTVSTPTSPLIQALTDPRTGGRCRLRDLRVRMLRPAMLRALYKAWVTSPFTDKGN